jgi:hypothetical protein
VNPQPRSKAVGVVAATELVVLKLTYLPAQHNQHLQRTRDLLRMSGHPDLISQERENAESRPKKSL